MVIGSPPFMLTTRGGGLSLHLYPWYNLPRKEVLS
nr:MAG TPA: hypothetical protein [Caudoviricetes sp.]